MRSPSLDLKSCTAVISGASQGIGRGIALSLGEAGATVYFTDRNRSALESGAAQVSERGGRGIGVVCDHTIDSQVEALLPAPSGGTAWYPLAG